MSIYDQIPQGSPVPYIFPSLPGDPLIIGGSLADSDIVLREAKGSNISKEEYDTALYNLAMQINYIGRGTFPQLKTAAYADKQTSASDATAGRALLVGAGGLLGNAVLSNDWNAIAASGLYYNSITTATGIPEATANLGLIHHNISATVANQIAFKPSTTTPYMWRRSKVSSAWGEWDRIALGSDINLVGASADYAASMAGLLDKQIQKNSICLEGPRSVFDSIAVMSSYEYRISNYDAFSTYSATTTAGKAVINNDKVILSFESTPPIETILTVKKDGYSQGFVITRVPSNIIGVVMVAEGNNGGIWAHIDVNGNPIGDPGKKFFDNHPIWGEMKEQIIDGQNMIRVPKFSVKVANVASGIYAGRPAWWVATGEKLDDGFDVHMAFWWAGAQKDQFWHGKYVASRDSADKLQSIPGVMPARTRTITQFATSANNRNVGGVTGFHQTTWWERSAIQFLYLVEHATMDCQTKTGAGRVNASSANFVDAKDVATASYRGIVGLWGNIWTFVEGMTIEAGRIWVWNKNQVLTDTGYTIPNLSAEYRYPMTFTTLSGTGWSLGHGLLAETNQASISGATMTDGHYFTTEAGRVALVGGRWNYTSPAGLFCCFGFYSASDSGSPLSACLAKV